jgi:hypothetical protein
MRLAYPGTDRVLTRSELVVHRKQFKKHFFKVFEKFIDEFLRDNSISTDVAPGRIFKPDTLGVMPKAAMVEFAMRQWPKFEDDVVQPHVVCHSHCPGNDEYGLHPDNVECKILCSRHGSLPAGRICPSWAPAQVSLPAA